MCKKILLRSDVITHPHPHPSSPSPILTLTLTHPPVCDLGRCVCDLSGVITNGPDPLTRDKFCGSAPTHNACSAHTRSIGLFRVAVSQWSRTPDP
eukprot:1483729-Prymnesium_polylepis.1